MRVIQALLAGFMLLGASCVTLADSRDGYPPEWWAPVDRDGAPDWEILPQDAGPGEVILSKRTELGILSNFAATPIRVRGKTYASVEGFWQAMKYPEGADDPRALHPGAEWPHTRAEVEQMSSFEAKDAGKYGSKIMEEMGMDWVTFEGRRMRYHDPEKGEHYKLILKAMKAKLYQNAEVKRILIATGDLKLRADHHQGDNPPPAWLYNVIWMELRDDLRRELGH